MHRTVWEGVMRKGGFSLVEMSIVILIIGLITASVTAGRYLFAQSKIRSFISDVTKYKQAITSFQEQYKYLPGDLPAAYNYWGSACGTNDSGALNSCNGNGNNRMDGILTSGAEDVKAFYHLMRAGLLNINVNGTAGIPDRFIPGTNIPGTPFSPNSGYQFFFTGTSSPHYNRVGNCMQVGAVNGSHLNGGFISAVNASSIDRKIDDGKASTGQMFTFWGNIASTCVTADWTAASADYILDDTSLTCRLCFWIE